MRIYLLLSVTVLLAPVWAQWPVITAIPAPFPDRAPAIASAPNGDILTGASDQIMRISQDGRVLWTRQAPLDQIVAVGAALDGGAFVTGRTREASVILKLDTMGRVVAARPIQGQAAGMTVDASGSAYITGSAQEDFIATPGAWKTNFAARRCIRPRSTTYFACSDAFVVKVRSDGSVEWATLLGGTWNDHGRAIAVDREGGVWVTGETMSEDLATTPNAMQGTFRGRVTLGPLEYGDAFLARLDGSGRRLLYSTYLGGNSVDYATSLTALHTVAGDAGVVVTGATQSLDFPVSPSAHQPAFSGDSNQMPNMSLDAFVAHFRTSGELLYATYFGRADQREYAVATAADVGGAVGIALLGRTDSCVLRYQPASLAISEECFKLQLKDPFAITSVNGVWIAVGRTLQGHEAPGVNSIARLVVSPLRGTGDNSGPAVVGLWNEYIPSRRPLVAADSIISIYHQGVGTEGVAGTSVRLGDRNLTLLYAGGDQINAAVPADMPPGLYPLMVGLPAFNTVPVAVDVVDRWPGLYAGGLNQDGTVNSELNPAPLGSIVSLFGSGFGPEPLPLIEPYIASTAPSTAQGMELLYAGRAPGAQPGIFQVNARVPLNANTGRVPVSLVFRVANGFLQTPLGYIWVR